MQKQLFKRTQPKTGADVFFTPEWCAKDMINFFKPFGMILDPCRGDGIFFNNLPAGSDWCEVLDGRDFYEHSSHVDWIISNPPYSDLREWINHSFLVADNIVYIVPIKNIFSAFGLVTEIRKYGGIKHIRYYGTGKLVDFPMGNAVGAVHFQRDYKGPIEISFYN